MTRISADDFMALVGETMPMIARMEIEPATLRLPFHPDHLRPGATIGGPVLMTMADVAMYAALLSAVGRVELAVTTNLNITFLRKPPQAALLAEARLLKLGRRLAVGEVSLYG